MEMPWDLTLKIAVCCLVQEVVVDSSLEFLILASDGLWAVVTNDVNSHEMNETHSFINKKWA
jgi:serine/threonine protein phosphatase PrpC